MVNGETNVYALSTFTFGGEPSISTFDVHKRYGMLKKLLLPMNLSKTSYTEWETTIEPDYTSYTIEAIHGYILNQIFINEGDVIELDVNLRTIIEIDTTATSTDAHFKGFKKTTIEETDGYNEDDWYYLGETLEKSDDLFYSNFKVYKLITGIGRTLLLRSISEHRR